MSDCLSHLSLNHCFQNCFMGIIIHKWRDFQIWVCNRGGKYDLAILLFVWPLLQHRGHGAVGGGKAGLAADSGLCVTAASSCCRGLPSNVPFSSDAQPCLEEGEVLPCDLPRDGSQCLSGTEAGEERFPCSIGGTDLSKGRAAKVLPVQSSIKTHSLITFPGAIGRIDVSIICHGVDAMSRCTQGQENCPESCSAFP